MLVVDPTPAADVVPTPRRLWPRRVGSPVAVFFHTVNAVWTVTFCHMPAFPAEGDLKPGPN